MSAAIYHGSNPKDCEKRRRFKIAASFLSLFSFVSFSSQLKKHCYLPSQPHLIPPNLLLKTMHHRDAAFANYWSSKWMRLNHVAWLVNLFKICFYFYFYIVFRSKVLRMGCVLTILMENITILQCWVFGILVLNIIILWVRNYHASPLFRTVFFYGRELNTTILRGGFAKKMKK